MKQVTTGHATLIAMIFSLLYLFNSTSVYGQMIKPSELHYAQRYSVELSQFDYWDHSVTQPAIATQLQRASRQYAPVFIWANGPNRYASLSATLIRKVVYNKNQHVNGLKFSFINAPDAKAGSDEKILTFAQIKAVELELAVDSTLSYLPKVRSESNRSLAEQKLISHRHNFSLRLFGQFHDNISQLTPYAEIRFNLADTNKRQTLLILKPDILFYASENYQIRAITKAQLDGQINGAILTAETANYSTLESLTKRQLNGSKKALPEELYIESHLKLRQINIYY